MTHRLTNNFAKNYCNRTLIVKAIEENVVTCFFFWGGGHRGAIFLPHSVFVFSKQSEFVQPLPCIEPVLSLPSVAVVMMTLNVISAGIHLCYMLIAYTS